MTVRNGLPLRLLFESIETSVPSHKLHGIEHVVTGWFAAMVLFVYITVPIDLRMAYHTLTWTILTTQGDDWPQPFHFHPGLGVQHLPLAERDRQPAHVGYHPVHGVRQRGGDPIRSGLRLF